ncbi:TetR/AcrR family transcriptional regulator [Arenibacterium halophilum]|uniref:TetR/AcrR family transcriptional regulator n=1 Tax=Arenibacterium halophilum TaxID=2583821 RepID=A0ABY2X9Z2_9RHOB|nr:TetR/AcrR family transcriptional regulator [Arenibacterium halophilum]TMV13198.1 TetR/AcrR family transcriptional regulator [Arenibacterium halophilum]
MARTQGSSSDITGPRIRRVAERLFAQAGYAAVSMRQIAAEVGVQAGALYNYTPDKQSLLFSLMERHLHEVLEGWDTLKSTGTPQEQLAAFVRFHIGFHLERPDAVFIAYMELRNLTPENFARVEGLRRRYETIPERILQAGIDAGEFAVPDPRVATLAVIAMLNGVNTWYRPGGRLTLEQVEDLYLDMVRKSLSAG